MKKEPKYKGQWIFIGCLWIISLLLLWISRGVSGFAQFYANHIYPIWVQTVGRVLGWFPFSVVEMLLYLMIIGIIVLLILGVIHMLQRKDAWYWILFRGVTRFWMFAGILFLLYTLNCGVNYYHDSFSEDHGMMVWNYSIEELIATCEYLTEEVNALAQIVLRDEQGTALAGEDAEAEAVAAMTALGEQYDGLLGYYPRPKGIMVSQILSYQNLSGIYSPFTIEANYNRDMTDFNLGFTMCHELSHLSGYMREDEANFIAWLACQGSENIEMKYSGALNAWIYCTNALYRNDVDAFYDIYEILDEQIKEDLRADSRFWNSYKGRIAEASTQLNNVYLQVHKQTEGVQTYNRMVDLMVCYLSPIPVGN